MEDINKDTGNKEIDSQDAGNKDTGSQNTGNKDAGNKNTGSQDAIKKNMLSLDKLHQLININLAINDNYDNFEVVLQRLLHAVEIITKSETTSLLMYDESHKDLIFKYATGHTAHDIIGLHVPHGEGVAHAVANTKKGIIINNIEDFGHYQTIDSTIEYKTNTMLVYPILDHTGEVFGIVEACNKEHDGKYTEEDFQLLAIFCQQAEKTIRHALHIHTLKNNITALTEKIECMRLTPIIHNSKEMKNTIDIMHRIAKSDTPVFIQGDKGTGKSLFALHIHHHSNRTSKELIRVSCTELVKTSENVENMRIRLWGIDKNYKIGIKKEIVGLFEKADGGTIILDEIEALPLEIQKEINTLLVQRFYYRVFSETSKILNVRVICTSAADLSKQIESNDFFEELYFLISSLPIRLSPLKKRIDDLSALIDYYFKYFVELYHKEIQTIEPQAQIILKRYNWKYNVQSLMSAINHLVLNCDELIITAEYVATYIFSSTNDGDKNHIALDDLLHMNKEDAKEKNPMIVSLKDAINTFKSQYLHKVLLLNNWNHTKTAKKLDIQRSYLSRLVKEYNINNKVEQ